MRFRDFRRDFRCERYRGLVDVRIPSPLKLATAPLFQRTFKATSLSYKPHQVTPPKKTGTVAMQVTATCDAPLALHAKYTGEASDQMSVAFSALQQKIPVTEGGGSATQASLDCAAAPARVIYHVGTESPVEAAISVMLQ